MRRRRGRPSLDWRQFRADLVAARQCWPDANIRTLADLMRQHFGRYASVQTDALRKRIEHVLETDRKIEALATEHGGLDRLAKKSFETLQHIQATHVDHSGPRMTKKQLRKLFEDNLKTIEALQRDGVKQAWMPVAIEFIRRFLQSKFLK
jgi:hypothetical protein